MACIRYGQMNESLPDEVQVMLSAWRSFFPPANEVCEGYVFTRVCLYTGGGGGIAAFIAGGIPACLQQVSRGVVSQHALQISRPTSGGEVEGSGLGGSAPRGACSRRVPATGGGVCSQGGVETPPPT